MIEESRPSQWLIGRPQDLQRKARREPCKDPRVDLCLFFISPCALPPADLLAIRRIAQLVPVLPIVARVGRNLTLLMCSNLTNPVASLCHPRRSLDCRSVSRVQPDSSRQRPATFAAH